MVWVTTSHLGRLLFLKVAPKEVILKFSTPVSRTTDAQSRSPAASVSPTVLSVSIPVTPAPIEIDAAPFAPLIRLFTVEVFTRAFAET